MQKKRPWLWIVWIIVGVVLLFVFVLPLLFFLVPQDLTSGNVALIEIRGVITTDGGADAFGEASTSSSTIVDFIEDAEEDSSIAAIVIDINSPGGSAVASDEIAQALKKATKPTVAFIHEIGTSGGYWVASATDTIIANRMSITGSIGVLASYLEFSRLMQDYGVSYERLVAGKHKDMGTPYKELTDEERKIFQAKLDRLHDFFIEEIAENRGLDEGTVRGLATGEFFLGQEALDLGLIDMVGDRQTLDAYLKETLSIEKIKFVVYEREPTLLDILSGVLSKQFFFMGKGVGKALTEQRVSVPAIIA